MTKGLAAAIGAALLWGGLAPRAAAQDANLSVTVNGLPSQVTSGGNVTYALQVNNQGPNTATNVVLTNTLPPGFTLVSANISVSGASTQQVNVIHTNNTVWRYDDTGTDQGTAWRDPAFNDSGWLSGRGAFALEAAAQIRIPTNTVLRLTNAAGTQFITYYFRTGFLYTNSLSNTTLRLFYQVDDGLVMYLNGLEIHRFNMPTNAITSTTGANAAFGEGTLVTTNITVTNLLFGSNVLAVEVHQNNNTSSDVYFGLGVDVLASSSPASYSVNGQDVIVRLGNLASGSFAAVSLVAKSGPAGLATNQVVVGSSTPDATPANNTGQAVVTVNAPPAADLVLRLSDYPDPIQVGNPLTYTLQVANTGALAAVNTVVTNWLPDNVTLGSITFSNVGMVTQVTSLVIMTNQWKFDYSGTDFGTAWIAPDYDDSSWASGAALLAFETITLPYPIYTVLAMTNSEGTRVPTHYFRTTFQYDHPPTNLPVTMRLWVDDGAVIYLNGVEIYRTPNMGSGVITYTSEATNTFGEGTGITNQLVLTNLVQGANTLAAEVHQNGTTSSDVVFGMSLELAPVIGPGLYTLKGNELVLYVDTIAPASTAAVSIVVTPTAAGTITNSASGRTTANENNLTNNSAAATTAVSLTPVGADLAVTMTDSPDPVIQNQNLTYNLTVLNHGPTAATDVRLTNSLPPSVTVISVSPGCVVTNGMVICNLGTLPVNGQSDLTFVVRPTLAGIITNAAWVTANEVDTVFANNVALATTVVETSLRADLSVTVQSAPNPVIVNEHFTNLVTIYNAGPSNATSVILTNRVQGNFVMNAIRINGPGTTQNAGGGVVICRLGTVAAGGSISIAFEMTANAVGGVTNTANVVATEFEPNPANNTVTLVTRVNPEPVADLVVTTEAPESVDAAETFDYIITISNAGTLTATDVRFTNLLSPAVTLLSFTNSQGVCSNLGGLVVGNLGVLAGGQSAVVTLRVAAPASGALTNVAGALATQPDFNPLDNLSVRQTVVIPNTAADLGLTVTPSVTNLYAGEELVYRLTLVNHGPLDATGIVITNWLPAGVTYLRGNVTAGAFANVGGALVFTLPSLPRDASLQASIVVRADQAGSLTNVAVAAASQADPTTNRVQTVVRAIPSADVQLVVRESSDPVAATAVLTYSIAVFNNGPSMASNTTLYCYLPVGAAFNGAFASLGTFTTNNGALIWRLGNLVAGTNATLEIDLVTGELGTAVSSIGVYANEYDPAPSNNTAVVTTAVLSAMGEGGIVISPTTNANALAAAITSASATGIKVNAVSLQANRSGASLSSGLYVIAATNRYGLTSPGVVLSTGDVAVYGSGENASTSTTMSYNRAATLDQERLLDPITGQGAQNYSHFDVTQLDIQFDMLAGFDRVTFKVVFGSEEYEEFVGSSFIDGFGIYLDGTNIAFAAGAPVNINHPEMAEVAETELDGVVFLGGTSAVMTFTAPVPPGSLNHKLTFIVADTSDSMYDTTVYISSLEGVQGANADLGLVASAAPEPVRVGDPVTFTLTITNLGPNTATNAVLTGTLPPVLTNISVTAPGSYTLTGGVLTCNLGNLARRSGASVTVRAQPSFDARFVTTFSVSSKLTDLAPANNSTSIISTAVDLGSYYNPNLVAIRDGAVALPYPAVITVAGLTGVVDRVVVTLLDLSHSFPADINALLVAPDGRNTVLMAAAGGGFAVQNLSLQFDDRAAASLPGNQRLTTGVYKPTNLAATNQFPGLASLAAPFYGGSLSVMRRADPNGDWRLYLYDNQGGDAGALAGGWNLKITTAPEMSVTVAGGNLILSWHDLPGYILEGTSVLTSNPVWTTVTQPQTVINGRRTVAVPMALGLKYFRLRK